MPEQPLTLAEKPRYIVCPCKNPPTLHYKQVFKTRLALPNPRKNGFVAEMIDNRKTS